VPVLLLPWIAVHMVITTVAMVSFAMPESLVRVLGVMLTLSDRESLSNCVFSHTGKKLKFKIDGPLNKMRTDRVC